MLSFEIVSTELSFEIVRTELSFKIASTELFFELRTHGPEWVGFAILLDFLEANSFGDIF